MVETLNAYGGSIRADCICGNVVLFLNVSKSGDFMNANINKVVLSLYDYTGVACIPWAERGYQCYCYDIQHDDSKITRFASGGAIYYINADLHEREQVLSIMNAFYALDTVFAMAFPVCTDMAVSGASHFKSKALKDPDFQTKAVKYAKWCAEIFEDLRVPYYVENPVSVLATQWRRPDYRFHPYQFGGYISQAKAEHPLYPDYIAPRDAYKKQTCLWVGGGFVMPPMVPVDPEQYHGNGYNTATMKLGGTSARTKNIRSATPRGFAEAAMLHNAV